MDAAAGSTRSFDDPEHFAGAIQNTNARLMLERPGAFRARLSLVRLPITNLTESEANLPRLMLNQLAPGRVYFRLTDFGDVPILANGRSSEPGTFRIRLVDAVEAERVPGASVQRSVSLPVTEVRDRARVLLGRDLDALLRSPMRWQPARDDFATVVALHRDAIRLPLMTPEVLAHPVAAAALDARISEAVLVLCDNAAALPDRAAARRGDLLMGRVLRLMEECPDRPLTLTEICAAARCSAKTIEVLFRDRFGQPPIRYLSTRRLWNARRELLAAEPDRAKVGDIAFGCGFWELGRFARAYRNMFGEAPSATLRYKRDFGRSFSRFTRTA